VHLAGAAAQLDAQSHAVFAAGPPEDDRLAVGRTV